MRLQPGDDAGALGRYDEMRDEGSAGLCLALRGRLRKCCSKDFDDGFHRKHRVSLIPDMHAGKQS
jgi:hypothetical protein